jgi:hypothetical protein
MLDGRSYNGWNRKSFLGLPPEKFVKTFRREPSGDWGHNLVVVQDGKAPGGRWEPKRRDGKPVEQGYYQALEEGRTLHLDYDVKRNTAANFPLRVIQDYVVLPNAGDHDLMLGKANFRLGPVRFFVCFFQLELRRE